MASAWGTAWGTSWAASWGAGVVVPPVEPPVVVVGGGGGGWSGGGWGSGRGSGGGRKKRRNKTEELFREIEATIREHFHHPVVTPATAVAAPAIPDLGEDLATLARYAKDDAEMSARLTALKRDLEAYHAEQQALRDDDDEFWMMV